MGAAVAAVAPAVGAIACAIGSIFGGGSRPASAPLPPSPQQLQELQNQLAEVERLRRELQQERNRQAESDRERERGLERRENTLREAEERAAQEAENQRRQEEEARNYPVPAFLLNAGHEGFVNVGLVGNAGAGKSLLCNSLRNLRRGDQGWAQVGVNETTMVPTMYACPDEPRARLWDMPGAGTPNFPTESYIRTVGLRHLDAVLAVSSSRFTETDVMLQNELREHRVPFFAVRTKLDIDIANNEQDNGMSADATKAAIVDDLRRRGIQDPYLIDTRRVADNDFPKLIWDLHAAVVSNRRY